jgi:hypothetical protein
MKVSVKYWQSSIAVVMVAIALIMSTPMVFAGNPNPGVLPPNSHPQGLTYGEWSARWWQYAVSVPGVPGQDVFNHCPAEPSGHVWFLEGTMTAVPPPTRSCTVPSGTMILFPIINAEWSVVEAQANGGACFIPAIPSGTSEPALRACAKAAMDLVTVVEADVDGVPLQGLTPPSSPYRVQSPLFTFTAVPGNLFVPAGPSQSVSDGYWIMLTPLSKGTHIVHFHGEAPSLPFTIDTTYNLTIG